jgi:glycosyltransferase involved in cell wall biosynthesis
VKILIVTPDLESNSVGRTYALWLLAEALHHETRVVSLHGTRIWEPLRAHRFASVCSRTPDEDELVRQADQADILIAVKPLTSSLIAAGRAARTSNRPLIADIDDPDLFATLAPGDFLRRIAKRILRSGVMRDADMRYRIARSYPTITSNWTLQAFHGGTVIPHVREPLGPGAPHMSQSPLVVFVGTNRKHKGTALLREAIAELHPETGIRITLTDEAPPDEHPWESWVGGTDMATGMELVGKADIVALPSLRTPFATGQLPAKLIDAMMLGRAVVVSDMDPMPWAIGEGGLVVSAGDKKQLKNALRRLTDPALRTSLGESARTRALAEFSVEANATRFETVLNDALEVGIL